MSERVTTVKADITAIEPSHCAVTLEIKSSDNNTYTVCLSPIDSYQDAKDLCKSLNNPKKAIFDAGPEEAINEAVYYYEFITGKEWGK